MQQPHAPVLLHSVLDVLGDIRGRTVVDATFGAGGYSRAFLERGARVVAFDRDPTVLPLAGGVEKDYVGRFEFINARFSSLAQRAPFFAENGGAAPPGSDRLYAVVFDLGVSSMQLDTPERGFSWRFDAPLDMRMGGGETAADLICRSSAADIAKILREYGDLKKAGPIARAIKAARPRTTIALRDLIFDPRDVAPVFQALRMAVNDELGEIGRALAAVPPLLGTGGICACVGFHSLESRMVKMAFDKWTRPAGDPRLPCVAAPAFRRMKTIYPPAEEIAANPRARSAQLRAVIKM